MHQWSGKKKENKPVYKVRRFFLFPPELSMMQSEACVESAALNHWGLFPIGCLWEIKENNCPLIGCLIFHGTF